MARRDCVARIRPIAMNCRRLPVLVLPFALLFMPLPTRAASPVAGQVNTLTAENSGKCLDDSGASIHAGNPIIQWTCNGGANQDWTLTTTGSNQYQVINKLSGLCLDVQGYSRASGAKIDQNTCMGRYHLNQIWSLRPSSGGGFALVSANSGKCLDVTAASTANGIQLDQWSCSGAASQSWIFKSVVSTAPPVNGICGTANGTVDTTDPTINLCSAGTASAVTGTGPWSWSCEGSHGGSTAQCSATSTTSQGDQGPVPTGLPSTFFIGLGVQPGSDQTWVKGSGVPWAVCYQYISSGVLPSQSWVTTWGTNFAYNYAVVSKNAGCIPQLTYYQLAPTIGAEGTSEEYAALNNAAIMADYYKDFTALMQQLHQYGGPALVHVEPDMWAFLEPLNIDPTKLTAAVAASGNADLAGYPNTLAGFGQALLHLRNLYAPNVVMGAHVSTWLWGLSTDASLNVAQIATKDAAYFTGLGNWDLYFTDISDRDAAYYQFVEGDGGAHWWDTTNQKYPNFNRFNEWADAFTTAAHKRLVIWQIPIGNTIMRTCNNTNFHYQDNRAQYWLQNYPTNQAISRLAQSGVIGLLFGAGSSGPTDNYDAAFDGITNPPPIDGNNTVSTVSDDDGGFLRLSVGAYYRSGPVPLE
jgi:hypothetical protein